MDQERLAWLEESKKFVNDSMQMKLERTHWGHERDLWQIERERWAEEQHQRDQHRPFFGAPRRSSERCLTYGTREYTAKLYNILTTEDWGAKCSNTAINIKGRIHEHPARCENHVGLHSPRIILFLILTELRVLTKAYMGTGPLTTTSLNVSPRGRSSGEVTVITSLAIG